MSGPPNLGRSTHPSTRHPGFDRPESGRWACRETGLATVRQTHMDIVVAVSGAAPAGASLPQLELQPMGLHLLTETLDGRFTEAYFKGGDGNLFKQ